MAPTGYEKQATDLGLRIAPDYTCEWISSGTQGKQLMIKKADGAPVLFVRRNSKSWGLFRPPNAKAIKVAPHISELANSVYKELGILKS
jgi:hypothetical protein